MRACVLALIVSALRARVDALVLTGESGIHASSQLKERLSWWRGLSSEACAMADDYCCIPRLVGTSQACRSEGAEFSITDFTHNSPFANELQPLAVADATSDDEAAAALNRSYPGLRVLDERHNLYAVDNFLSSQERQALIKPYHNTFEFTPMNTSTPDPEWAFEPQNAPSDNAGTVESAVGAGRPVCSTLQASTDNCAQIFRNSHSAYADLLPQEALKLQEKIRSLLPGLGSATHTYEGLQLTRYAPGGFYSNHVDGRRATVLMYLDSVGVEGGATSFPELGIRIAPEPGQAVIFFSRYEDGRDKPTLLHAAEELVNGEKHVAQQWILSAADRAKDSALDR